MLVGNAGLQSVYFRSNLYTRTIRKWGTTGIKIVPNVTLSSPSNPMNIQLLPKDLHAKLFPNTSTSKPKKKIIQLAQQHLQSWDIPLNKPVTLPEVCFDLPSLEGDNIAEHFYNIGLAFENQYTSLLHRYLRMNFTSLIPSDFVFQKGWTKYSKNSPPKSVSFPDEDVLTFDIEVLYKVSKYPVMATALGENGFYAWISPWLIDPLNETSEHLISLGNRPLLVIGHNVSFDRQAILEEYALKQTKTLFLDTMSLHCATHGMSTQQIDRYKEAKKDQNHRDGWFQYASLSSLSDLSQYYLSQVLDKESRNYFEQHDIQIIQDKYQTLLEYCAKDTLTTYRVLKKLYPEYTGKCPHPVSFISMLMMGSSYLPVTNSWNTFIQECEKKVQEWTQKIESALYQLAIKALETYIDTSKGREVLDQPLQSSFPLTKYATESLIIKNRELSLNPWLSQLDWTLKPLRLTKKGKAMANQVLPNYPQWFVNLWDSKLKKIVISPRKEVAPLLLQLKWREFPLFYSKSFKWGYLVPPNGKADVGHIEIKLNDCNTIIDSGGNLNKELFLELIKQGYTFFRLPHKDGNSYNSGTPFSKFHLTYFEQDILHSENLVAKEVVLQQVQCAYWVVTSDRIKSQFVVWQSKFPSIPFIEPFISAEDENSNEKKERKLPEFVTTHHPIVKELPMDTKTASNQIQLNKKDFGVILPMVVVMGTLTRRAVEPTWMTASNSKKTRIGSDLKRYVVAPPGYAIVGADVDAEELWILSILGDACFGIHGSTAVSWRNLQGQKSDGTDLHSVTAKILGISRDAAKQFNYARYYGAGENFAAQLLMKNNPNLSSLEVLERIQELYSKTKGKKVANSIRKPEGGPNHSYLSGGSETFMFNVAEHIARSNDTRTPALHCQIPSAMLKQNTGNEYMTSRMNWVIQSSGVDYLHSLIISMAYLIKKYKLNARLMLTIHDEIRYLVKEEDKYRAALALQISNLWVRTLFAYQLGFEDLPLSVAFFSGVDIDHCLRKETNDPCITPTNSIPVPPGETLTIYDLIDELEIKLGECHDWKILQKDLPKDFFPIKLDRNLEWLRAQMEQNSDQNFGKHSNFDDCRHGYL